ncbi:hypothetical protein H0194_04710 [Corynebacterium incognita]|uniref:Uncharacterized protein n=1 Tax=Corynebacterium incognita TaxID=2754725 RepID=A0A7G7CRR6_9CORY|nr:hypothetical protein [Corynebacterium incognita]QNE90282.1 hypothetical protein H0194_04710 [Corynebacterium incognita]
MTETVEVPRALIEAGDIEAIKKLLPGPTGLLGRWATHPVLGRVMCVHDSLQSNGLVPVALVSGGENFTADLDYHELTFDPVELGTEQDFREAPEGTVVAAPSVNAYQKVFADDWESLNDTLTAKEMASSRPWQVLRWGGKRR